VLTYTNFGHRDKRIFEAFSNVQPFDDFRQSLAKHFIIERCFPVAYNWHGGQPVRALLQSANMPVKVNIPLIGTGWPSITSSSALVAEQALEGGLTCIWPRAAGGLAAWSARCRTRSLFASIG